MASPTPWTWVWASPGSWWWTGRPDVLQSMGLQRVGHDWVTELTGLQSGEKTEPLMSGPWLSSSLLPSFYQAPRENLQSVCSNLKELTPALKMAWDHSQCCTWRLPYRGGSFSLHPSRFDSWVCDIVSRQVESQKGIHTHSFYYYACGHHEKRSEYSINWCDWGACCYTMLSCVQLSGSLWTRTSQAPLSTGISGVGCHFLLQGIFSTQGSNLCLLHWQADSLPLSR